MIVVNEFDLYGKIIKESNISKNDENFVEFLAEEELPVNGILLSKDANKYNELADHTSNSIFVVTINHSDDDLYEEKFRFSSIDDIIKNVNNDRNVKSELGLYRYIDRAEVAKSIREHTVIADKMAIFRLSDFPIEHRKKRLKFTHVNRRFTIFN